MVGAVTGGGGVTFIPYVPVEWANILVVLHLFHTYTWNGPIFWWCYIYSMTLNSILHVEWANILVVLHLFHTYTWNGPIFWWCYIYSIRTRGMGQYFGGVTFIP